MELGDVEASSGGRQMTVLQLLHYLSQQGLEKPKHNGGVMFGDKPHNWKGGRFKREGYVFVLSRDHPFADAQGYVREHRLVMEKFLGRIIPRELVVHHINGIKTDNRIENLQLLTQKEHRRLEALKLKPWRFRKKLRQTDDTSDDSDAYL